MQPRAAVAPPGSGFHRLLRRRAALLPPGVHGARRLTGNVGRQALLDNIYRERHCPAPGETSLFFLWWLCLWYNC
ncbi:hypothetical protein Acr_23g0013910 [Actinidia rufa]|uniref:Uncharacterized protein n=1 Tax=Actinidia rufa TaxID=165716 RepID=A0A7J0GQC5_9ERIC|nr:hypothetical protein Acr_23g0013910 [Actinidia rufa]